MHPMQFDRLTRLLDVSVPRRGVLALGISAVGLGASHHEARLARKKKKAAPNEFGCLNVGQPCRGKDSSCCSGVCQGKKPKPGKRDNRKCAGHNEGQCSLTRDLCAVSEPVLARCNPNNLESYCFVTTGQGAVCGLTADFTNDLNCRACARDSDCTAAGFPPGSACVVMNAGPVSCGNCATTNFRACMPPGI